MILDSSDFIIAAYLGFCTPMKKHHFCALAQQLILPWQSWWLHRVAVNKINVDNMCTTRCRKSNENAILTRYCFWKGKKKRKKKESTPDLPFSHFVLFFSLFREWCNNWDKIYIAMQWNKFIITLLFLSRASWYYCILYQCIYIYIYIYIYVYMYMYILIQEKERSK